MNTKICAAMLALSMSAAQLAAGFGLHSNDPREQQTTGSPPRKASRGTEVYAVWYDVPPKSLARRRAGKAELTAAHNRLPIGTLVRVTNPTNNKSVVVRITDRGITNRRAKIDICKEAAEEIDIVHQGMARVRIEVLPSSPSAVSSASGPVPVTAQQNAH